MISALLLGAFLGANAAAEAKDQWNARVFATAMSTASNQIVLGGGAALTDSSFRLADGEGVALELEYLWRPRIGLELMVFFGELDAELRRGSAGLATTPVVAMGTETYTLGVNYRLDGWGRVEISLGGFAGFNYYDDVVFSSVVANETFRFDDDLGFGVKAGFDLPIGTDGPWLVTGAARWQSSILEGEVAGQDMDVDPLTLSLGVGYRF